MEILDTVSGIIPRTFKLIRSNETITLEDPNDSHDIETVRNIYSTMYPDLLNATVTEKGFVDGALTFEFSSIAGTKG